MATIVPAPQSNFADPPRGSRKVLFLFGLIVLLILGGAGYAIVQSIMGDKPTAKNTREEPAPAKVAVSEEVPQPPATINFGNKDDLIAGLKHKDGTVRYKALLELSKLSKIDAAAAKPLATLLQDTADHTAALEMRKLAARCLGKLGADAEPVLPQLIIALNDESKEVALLSLEAIGKVGKPGIPPLTDALRHKEPAVRAKAGMILGGYGADAAVAMPTLLQLLAEANNDDRAQLAVQIVRIDPAQKEVIKYLLASIIDGNDNNRLLAFQAFALMGPNAESVKIEVYDAFEKEANKQVKDAAEDAYRKITGQ
jgi:hypothetical protein